MKIVVVGNGLGAALAASTLAARTDTAAHVMVVGGGDDPHGLGPVGRTIATRPGFRRFLHEQGLDADDIVAAADGAFTLGQAFSGWRGDDHGWMLPYGDIGAPIESVAFQHLLHRRRATGRHDAMADYAIAAVAAQSERFARPSPDPASARSAIDYGLSFDTDRLATILAGRAVALGVTFADRPVVQVDRAAGRTRLRLNDGRIVIGDLFLDLTGGQALLAQDHGWQDWRHWFPCDRALVALARDVRPPLPFTHGGVTANGWRSSVAVNGGRGDVLFVASAFGSVDAAARELGLPVLADVAVHPGRRDRFWQGDVIAMGAAGSAIEPLHPLALDQLAAAVERLLALFPAGVDEPLLAAEYDRRTIAEVERARDFVLLHHALSDRTEPMWRAVRDSALPDGAAWKLDQYRSRGRVSLFDNETFGAGEWAMLFDAMGVRAERRDALADLIPVQRIDAHFTRLREAIVAEVRRMPTHAAVLAALSRQRPKQ